MIKYFRFVLAAVLLCGLAGVSYGAPKHIKKHALAKVAMSTVAVPKAAAVGLKDTIGGVLFAVEAGVDVAHVATTALSAAASKELKHNPFEYVDKAVAYADTGLEKGYLFFFHAQI